MAENSGSDARRPAPVRAVRVLPDDGGAGRTAADFADAFAIRLSRPIADLRKVVGEALGTPPLWFRLLIGLRDRVVAPFGVETSAMMRRAGSDADRIDFFPVLQSDATVLVLGARDRHLDFTVSFRVAGAREGDFLIATTRVWFRNRFGRLYLGAIEPFHRMVVRAMLRRVARQAANPIRS